MTTITARRQQFTTGASRDKERLALSRQPFGRKENMKLILKIAAGVLLALLVFTGLYEYERTSHQDERDVAVLKSEAMASIDELGKTTIDHKAATATATAARPTALQLEQKKCERLKASYFATRNAAAISRPAAEHCHSVAGTDHAFFSNVMDGTLSIYDLPAAKEAAKQ
jgi:hypothetical protein